MDKQTALKSCFIVASIAVNIETLRSALANRGIQVRDALSLPSGPGSILGAIESAIRGADFICAIIVPQMSPNVLFEIGLAYGARKPLFLIVDKGADLPANLKDIFYVRASPSDAKAIEFNLNHFLEHQARGVSRKYPEIFRDSQGGPYIPSSSLKGMLRATLESLQRSEGAEAALALESLVADLFAEASAVVAQERYHPDAGADMAVWLDDIESSLGNPLLVEVKSGRLSQRRLEQAELQLRRYLTQTNAQAGLLVYFDQAGQRFPSSSSMWPLVVRFDVRDLADIISRGELVATLLKERNKAAHGRV